MGRLQAEAMADTGVDLKTMITWHLRSNHYPPHPYEMIPVAIRAIKKATKGRFDDKIKCPFAHSKYGKMVPVFAIITSLHLEEFV